jgi:hypothetical protein
MACAIYFLDRPVSASRSLWRYLAWPIIWMVTGIASAITGQASYIVLSGNRNNLGSFTTSLSSQLLWYRLWPNATYPLGVFLGILIVSFPLVLITGEALLRHLTEWHPVRLMGLGAMLIFLLAGGLLVSIKIGGGSDLHNLDSYRILLALIAMSFYFGCTVREARISTSQTQQVKGVWLILSLMISVIFLLNSFLQLGERKNIPASNIDYADLKQIVSQASAQKKSILFISQRQLLAFGMVNAPLIPQYEYVELTEMAMAGNDEYLNRFYSDIHQHLFDIIIADISTINRRGQDYAFGEESNLWVDSVYSVLFCEYQPDMILENAGVQIIVPRPQPDHCPSTNQ